MEGLLNIYQALRAQPFVPFAVAALFLAPLLFQLKKKGGASLSSWLSFGVTAAVWLAFAIYNVAFRPEPFLALSDAVFVGLPLLVFSVNSVLFWAFGLLSHSRA